ncbi:MAG UNVERIFIED_CONTAM: hypothetical protein LVT10_21005 [Anaerolineae bacterium]
MISKTPLTSIQGFSQAILDGTATDVHKAATIIYDEAGRLARMVNQLTGTGTSARRAVGYATSAFGYFRYGGCYGTGH